MGRGRKIGTLESMGEDNSVGRDQTQVIPDATILLVDLDREQTNTEQVQPEIPSEQPQSEPVSQSATAPQQPLSLKDAAFLTAEQKEMILQENLSKILCAPKVKGALPTIVRFKEKDSIGLRTVIIDIGAPVLYDAWTYYKANVEHPYAEDFLQHVYTLTKMRIPRLYKVVAELRLD